VLPTAIKDGDMPNWKKVIVSGSNVSQLNNDGVYLRTIGDGVITSSAQLTSTFDTRYLNTTGDGVISSSAQIATNISGAFTAPSGGFSTRITSLEAAGGTTFSSSIAGRVTNVETDLNTLESKTLVSSSAQLTTEFDTRYLNTTGDGVISSSAQLTGTFDTRYLNTIGDGVISSSAQVDHDSTTNFVANEHIDHTSVSINAGNGLSGGGTIAATRTLSLNTSSAHFTDGVKKKLNTDGVISSSAQLTSTFDTRYLNTIGDGVISSSAQISSQISGAFTAVSGGLAGRITSLEAAGGTNFSSSVSTRLTSVEGYTLDSVTDNGSSTTNEITIGGLTVNGNISITGTASIGYLQSVSGSAKIIGDAYIILNNDTPAQRFAGIVVQDSGSTENTASFEFDGLTNDWFYEYTDDGGVTTDHGIALFGPAYNTKGSPTYPTSNKIQKGTGTHHLADSIITDNGTTATISGSLNITTVNAAGLDTDKFLVLDSSNNVDYRTGAQVLSDINPGGLVSSSAQLTSAFDTRYLNTTGDGVISSSAQVIISSTTGYTTFSSSIASDIAALEGAGYATVGTFASGAANESQRFALWQDTSGTVGGHPNFEYDTANGIIRMPDRSIRAHAVLWTTGTVSFAIASPVSSYGAAISYTFFRADAGRSAFKAGNITTAYNNAGTSVVFNETTTADFGVLTPLTVNVVVIGGVMHVQFTQTSGNSHGVSCNIDVMGI
jgi:hypothetical protein